MRGGVFVICGDGYLSVPVGMCGFLPENAYFCLSNIGDECTTNCSGFA